MSKTKNYAILNDLIHELRTDITLYNFSESVADQKSSIESILRLLERVELLGNDEVDARSLQKVDLNQVVSRVISNLPDALSTRVSVQLQSAQVLARRDLIEVLVEELLSNALRYSDGDVQISLHNTDQHAVVRVEDEGGGLPREMHESVGDAFFKSGEQHSGRGLGLAIAWAITQAHEGGLTLISDEGEGVAVMASFKLAG